MINAPCTALAAAEHRELYQKHCATVKSAQHDDKTAALLYCNLQVLVAICKRFVV